MSRADMLSSSADICASSKASGLPKLLSPLEPWLAIKNTRQNSKVTLQVTANQTQDGDLTGHSYPNSGCLQAQRDILGYKLACNGHRCAQMQEPGLKVMNARLET
jgi:hypothetical protein